MGKYDVGGVSLDRPFKVRRLGHVGLFLDDLPAARRFYSDDLGFGVTDVLSFTPGETQGYFMSNNADHHAVVCIDGAVGRMGGDAYDNGLTVNQISFQVNSLEEVVNGHKFLVEHDIPIWRIGRDSPGSNWACYGIDPDGFAVEFYYGMEQIGWNGRSKPYPLRCDALDEPPTLPQPSEADEVLAGESREVDMSSGHSWLRPSDAAYTLGGVHSPLPHRISRVGPVHLFVKDIDKSIDFYTRLLGLELTETAEYAGYRAAFLRLGSDHHVVGLFEAGLREALGYSQATLLAHLGFEVSTYRQLRDASAYLTAKGWAEAPPVPRDLLPGIGYAKAFLDPLGHAVLLYFGMEQIGWDGRPRPAADRPDLSGPWPETLADSAGAYTEPTRQGPWA
ncbi:Catechol 2,3-dioxygenase [Prauserella aidingensis]|uniref:VOC family protein n=1 Tax=Prauserella aidingensis TaxID=387890 RepID=UPI0020A4C650|nr:VOC family protein [Prauserella aidingensis]MCP2256020.1 Catechol 2,3-dioxygenase [Prauserella aidingensis]